MQRRRQREQALQSWRHWQRSLRLWQRSQARGGPCLQAMPAMDLVESLYAVIPLVGRRLAPEVLFPGEVRFLHPSGHSLFVD